MEIEYRSVADFGEIITGKTPSTSVDEFWSGEIPFITPTDIVGYDMRYIFSTERQITDEGANSQINTILPKNTICVSCIASIGKMCITSAAQSITNQQINSIVVKKGYDYQYLFYLLRYFLPYIQLIGGGTGSGTPIISKTKFSKLKYPVCVDKAIQARIAVILSTYDSLIEVNNKRIKVLEQIAENLYKEWFVRFRFPGHENAEFENGMPKGWEYKKLDRLLDVRYGKDHKTVGYGDIPVFGSGGLMRYGDRALYDGEAVLIPRKGSLNNIMYYNAPFWTVDTMFYSIPLISNFAKYAYYMLSHVDMESYNSGAALPSMTTDILYHFKILVPNEGVLEAFDKFVSDIFEQINAIKRVNDNLVQQRDLLLPRLMSGKLEV